MTVKFHENKSNDITKTKKVVSLNDIPYNIRMNLLKNEQVLFEKNYLDKCKIEKIPLKDSKLNLFKAYYYGLNDLAIDESKARNNLEQYIKICIDEGEHKEEVYFRLFQNFKNGDNGFISNTKDANTFADYLQESNNVNILKTILDFYLQSNQKQKVSHITYLLYNIFYNGIGIDKDYTVAEKYLKESLNIENTEIKREKLRELYSHFYQEGSDITLDDYCFKRVIDENI